MTLRLCSKCGIVHHEGEPVTGRHVVGRDDTRSQRAPDREETDTHNVPTDAYVRQLEDELAEARRERDEAREEARNAKASVWREVRARLEVLSP